MMNEEQYIRNRMGERNPFRVPDGYFDSLAAEMMKQLPLQASTRMPDEQLMKLPQKSLFARLRPWMYAAACLVGVLLTVSVFFMESEKKGQEVAATTPVAAETYDDNYADEAADYVMADNIDIYACLASDF
jgi:hypothetical protein